MRSSSMCGLVVMVAVAAGCNQADPSDDEGAGEVFVPMGDGERVSHFPLVDGGMWTYVATEGGAQVGLEIVEAQVTTFAGGEAFVFADNPDDTGEWTESTIARVDTSAYRVHKEIMTPEGAKTVVDYDPGFTRFDDAWTEVGGEGERRYQRTEQKPMDPTVLPDEETRGHVFNVLAVDERITVPAGTFDTVAIERVRTTGASAGERVLFWYAAGVGKVREERPADGRVEELTEVAIPGGAMLP